MEREGLYRLYRILLLNPELDVGDLLSGDELARHRANRQEPAGLDPVVNRDAGHVETPCGLADRVVRASNHSGQRSCHGLPLFSHGSPRSIAFVS